MKINDKLDLKRMLKGRRHFKVAVWWSY